MSIKKLVSIITVLCLVLCALTSCGEKPQEEDDGSFSFAEDENTERLTLAYSKSDSLNPYEAESEINLQIANLVFDGLFKTDGTYNPKPVIAESVSVNGISITVNLRNVMFSDGTSLSAGDVRSSFEAAKQSDFFAPRLENIAEISTPSSGTVVFTLINPDPYVTACLDFPVVKRKPAPVISAPLEGSTEPVTAGDSEIAEEELPVGSGRYAYARVGETLYLVVNTGRSDFNPAIKTINLEAVHDTDSLDSSLVVGNTAIYYNDLSGGAYNRINAKTVEMGLNSIIYLGFNPDSSFFSDSRARQAVSLSIDREEAAGTAFQSHARAAALPFNPDWYVTGSLPFAAGRDTQKAAALLEEAGIDPRSDEVSVIYNSENGFKSQLAAYVEQCLEETGFIVRTMGVEASQLRSEITSGNYDIYIGECRLTRNMSLAPLFSGDASYGTAPGSESETRYAEFLAGSCEIMDFINTFNSDMPFVPVCFRNAAVSYTKAVNGDFSPCDGDVFYDIESWSIR